MAEVPELGNVNNKEIGAILGVAPFIKQSGKSQGTAAISGGRKKSSINLIYGLSCCYSM